MHRSPRATVGALFAAVLLVVPACGGGDKQHRFEVHPASGEVRFGGKPLPGAFVRFHPVDPATVAIPEGKEGQPPMLTTETDRDGKFTMSTYLTDDGVPAGDYKVTVAVGLQEAEVDIENSDGMAIAPAPKKAMPGKVYRDAETTPLKATVRASGENHFVFDVE
jgi:hypothetical protein